MGSDFSDVKNKRNLTYLKNKRTVYPVLNVTRGQNPQSINLFRANTCHYRLQSKPFKNIYTYQGQRRDINKHVTKKYEHE